MKTDECFICKGTGKVGIPNGPKVPCVCIAKEYTMPDDPYADQKCPFCSEWLVDHPTQKYLCRDNMKLTSDLRMLRTSEKEILDVLSKYENLAHMARDIFKQTPHDEGWRNLWIDRHSKLQNEAKRFFCENPDADDSGIITE